MPRVRNKGLNRGATRDIPQQETFRQGPGLNPREAPIGSTFVQPVRPLDVSGFKKDAQAPQTIGNRFLDIARALGTFSEGLQSYVGLQETYAKLNAALGQADAISGKKFNRPNSFLNQGWGYDKGFEIAKGTEAGAKIQAEYLQRLQAANYGIEDITKDTAEQIKARRDELYNAVANDILGGASVSPDFLEGAADHMLSAKVAGEKAAGEAYQRQRIGKHLEVVTSSLRTFISGELDRLPKDPEEARQALTRIRDGENEEYNRFFQGAKERGFSMSRDMFNQTKFAVYEQLIEEYGTDLSKTKQLIGLKNLLNAKDSAGVRMSMLMETSPDGTPKPKHVDDIRSLRTRIVSQIAETTESLTKLAKAKAEDTHTRVTAWLIGVAENGGLDENGVKVTDSMIAEKAKGVDGNQMQDLVGFFRTQMTKEFADDPEELARVAELVAVDSPLSQSQKLQIIGNSPGLSGKTKLSLKSSVVSFGLTLEAATRARISFDQAQKDREQRESPEEIKKRKEADAAERAEKVKTKEEDRQAEELLVSYSGKEALNFVGPAKADMAKQFYRGMRSKGIPSDVALRNTIQSYKHIAKAIIDDSFRTAPDPRDYLAVERELTARFGAVSEEQKTYIRTKARSIPKK